MDATKTSETFDRALMNDPQANREAERSQANREELTERIAQAIRQDGMIEPLKGLIALLSRLLPFGVPA